MRRTNALPTQKDVQWVHKIKFWNKVSTWILVLKRRRDRKSYVQHDLLYNVMIILKKKGGEKKSLLQKGSCALFSICKLSFISYRKRNRDCVNSRLDQITLSVLELWGVDIKMTDLRYYRRSIWKNNNKLHLFERETFTIRFHSFTIPLKKGRK